jgi:hypothetical protein
MLVAAVSINRLNIKISELRKLFIDDNTEYSQLLPIFNNGKSYYSFHLINGEIIVISIDQDNNINKEVDEHVIKELIVEGNQVRMTLFETPIITVYRGNEKTTKLFGLDNHHYHQVILGSIIDQDQELPYAICSTIRDSKELKELRVYCYQNNWGAMEWQVLLNRQYTNIAVNGNRVTTQKEENGQLVTEELCYSIVEDKHGNRLKENGGEQLKLEHPLDKISQ